MKVYGIIFLLFVFKTSNSQVVAPDFTLTDINSISRNLYSELDLGKTVVLDFFSTSCGACISNIPILQDQWQANGYNGDSLWIWGIEVNGITDSALLNFNNQYSFSYPVYSTYNDDIVVPLYNITYTPQYWVVCPSRFMKYVSISNLDQAIKGCNESNSIFEFSMFCQNSYFRIEGQNLIKINNNISYPINLKVYNLLGYNVFELMVYPNTYSINVNSLSSGVYIISTTDKKGNVVNDKIFKY